MRRRLTPAPRWTAAVLVAAILVLVALAAMAARGLPGRESRPPPFAIDIDLLAVSRVMIGILAGLAALVLILALLPGGPRIDLPERKKWPLLRMLAVMALFIMIAIIFQPLTRRGEQGVERPASDDVTTEAEASIPQPSGSRWGLVILGGAVLLVVWGVAVATRSAGEPEEEDSAPDSVPEAVAGVIDQVLADLQASDDPREVVIGAYARMERALTEAGLPRRASEAPLEYLTKSLRRLRVTRPAVTRLTRLFEVARFSDHEIDDEMGREAVDSLREVRAELSGLYG